MNTEPELLNERLERLAIVLDEIMPQCALLVRDAISLLKEQEGEWLDVDDEQNAFDCSICGAMVGRKCLYCPGCGAKMKNGTRAIVCV
jgi:hypothetical protein